MLNLKHLKLVKELKNIKPQLSWLKFSSAEKRTKSRDEFLNSIIEDNKFIEEDLKIRAMVEDMLEKEFSKDIKNIKSYEFLVDSVINKIKMNQLGISYDEEQLF